MKVLGLDFETTSLEIATTRVIEIGAILWDTDRKLPLELLSCLVLHPSSENVVISKETLDITRISLDDVKDHGITPLAAFEALHQVMSRAEYIVAHNGTFFDKPIYLEEIKRLGLPEIARPWIDTRVDIAYPGHLTSRSAGYLEEQHKLVNPFPHRAVFDVVTMLQLLSLYDISDVIRVCKTSTVLVKANVSYDDRAKAKERGYFWNATEKQWLKCLKEPQVEDEKVQAGFEVVLLKKVS
jgi:DNA polymerase III alpha subunit (gram-positive type)